MSTTTAWVHGFVTCVVGRGLSTALPWPVAMLVGGATASFATNVLLASSPHHPVVAHVSRIILGGVAVPFGSQWLGSLPFFYSKTKEDLSKEEVTATATDRVYRRRRTEFDNDDGGELPRMNMAPAEFPSAPVDRKGAPSVWGVGTRSLIDKHSLRDAMVNNALAPGDLMPAADESWRLQL